MVRKRGILKLGFFLRGWEIQLEGKGHGSEGEMGGIGSDGEESSVGLREEVGKKLLELAMAEAEFETLIITQRDELGFGYIEIRNSIKNHTKWNFYFGSGFP